MASFLSPRKRERSHSSRLRRPKESQESKFTSTPNTARSFSLPSPSVSTIARSSISGESEQEYGDIFLSKETEDYDEFFQKVQKIKYKGVCWKHFKPLNANSLYNAICLEPDRVEYHANSVLVEFRENPRIALIKIQQFFLDVANYQNFKLEDHYDSDLKIIFTLLETSHLDKNLTQTKTYLFQESLSFLGLCLRNGIFNFVQKLVILSTEQKVIYDLKFFNHIEKFLKCMSSSMCTALRHTGVVFAAKLLTGLQMVINDDSLDPQQKQFLNDIADHLFFIFNRNWGLMDPKLYKMRKECVLELSRWIRLNPKFFISQYSCLKHIRASINDDDKTVRIQALTSLSKIIADQNLESSLRRNIKELLYETEKRFDDVHFGVAAAAIDVFKASLKLYSSCLTAEQYKKILFFLFHKDLNLAQTASKFIKVFFTVKNESLWNGIIRIIREPEFSDKRCVGLLIEACIDSFEEFQNLSMYHQILTEVNDGDFLNVFFEMIIEVFSQLLRGCSFRKTRNASRRGNVEAHLHRKTANMLLKDFPFLISTYQHKSDHILSLLTILSFINADCYSKSLEFCPPLVTLFFENNEEKVLQAIVDLFKHLMTNVNNSASLELLIKGVIKRLVDDFQSDSQSPETRRKIKIMFSKFDLTEAFYWERIFELSDVGTVSMSKNHLVWSLKNIIKNRDKMQKEKLSKVLENLKSRQTQWLRSSFQLLEQDLEEHFEIFSSICELLEEVFKETAALQKINPSFKLHVNLETEGYYEAFMTYLCQRVIEKSELALEVRQESIVRVCNLVEEALPAATYAYILKYVYSRWAEFDSIFKDIISTLFGQKRALGLIISKTIIMCYSDLRLSSPKSVTEESTQLKLLIKKLLEFKEIKHSSTCELILSACMKFVFRNLSLLFLLKYFVEKLNKESLNKISETFEALLGKSSERPVVFFRECLQKKGAVYKKHEVTQETSSVSTEDNLEIDSSSA